MKRSIYGTDPNYPRMLPMILVFFAMFSSVIQVCAQERTDPAKAKREYRILFVGNSLTYTNDLPKLVVKSAKKRGLDLSVKMIAYANYALVDHWNDGKVQKFIKTKKYDFVILQQGPSSQIEGRQMLIEDGKRYQELCRSNEARLCYFMVWPSISRYFSFDGVIQNHRDAAKINQAILLPVGEAWKAHIDSTENYDYYGPDGFHPSAKGSQVTADLIVRYLFVD